MKTKQAKKPKFEELEHGLGLWFALFLKVHGEASSVDSLAVHSGRCDLKALLSEYSPCDVYNIDETGLFD